MNRFWPPREAAQVDYERIRERVLSGDDGLDLVTIRFQQNVGQNWNRGLLLNDTLREIQFANQISPTDGEFHGGGCFSD